MTVLTKADFNQAVLDSNGITFVEFFASWCPHCRAFYPEYCEIAEELGNEANFYQVEIDQSRGLADEYGIESIPTIVVFKNGQEVYRFVGAQPVQVFQEIIQDLDN